MVSAITDRHPIEATVGYSHASTVNPVVSRSDAALGTSTSAFVPLNVSALPYRPAVVHVAEATSPLLPFPDASRAVVPLPSLNPHAATAPVSALAGEPLPR